MLLDANLLLYAVHKGTDEHDAAAAWLTKELNGSRRVGLPWQSLAAFLRIATHPRAFRRPLAPKTAWERVSDWLGTSVAWVPEPGPEYRRILGDLRVMSRALCPEHPSGERRRCRARRGQRATRADEPVSWAGAATRGGG
jgi:predicted nucleic acid-binding protein